jgi:hypothetical protein
MSKSKVAIAFKDIHKLWSFAQKMSAKSLEIITTDMILICHCSESELQLLPEYGGKVILEYTPMRGERSFYQNKDLQHGTS